MPVHVKEDMGFKKPPTENMARKLKKCQITSFGQLTANYASNGILTG